MSCPIVSKSSGNQDTAVVVGDSAEKEFQKYTSAKVKDLFDGLRKETLEIESNIAIGEKEVLDRDQHAYMMRRHELSVAYMQAAHAADLQKQKEALEAILVARSERKKAKKEGRKSIRASKRRDQTIQQQKKSADAAARIRESISEKRSAFDSLTQHMYEIHEKQRKNLLNSQERTFSNEKLLVDLETRHLKEEVRTTILKKFQVRQNHLGHLNKRINDNLREVQLMELRHSKEKFELEMVCFEEIGSKRIIHENTHAELKLRHQNEMHNEKESVLSKRESAKEAALQKQHAQILRQLAYNQRIELRQLRVKHEIKVSSNPGSKGGSKAHSRLGSGASSKQGSAHGSDILAGGESRNSALPRSLALEEEMEEVGDGSDELRKEFGNLSASLLTLARRHKEEITALEAAIKKEINDINLSFEVKLSDMEEAQNNARIKLIEDQEREIEELKESQEKEIRVEEMMHDSEMKMLVERRILNSVLETVADGIINITPIGDIVRFNHAAEGMFGYKASEVIGKNIKTLMPLRFSENHHQYLLNYLTTGVKKVIGSGRRVYGLKKNGEEFPLHLSISELKEDGEHLFTGIARDLTEEVALENKTKQAEEAKKKELEKLLVQLNQAKAQSDNLLGQMLPASVSKQLLSGRKVEPQSFKSATVFFLDVVGFTTISAQVDPLEIVHLLNSLYSVIDCVIERYNVYKVETIGDSYMIVSGLPVENTSHASEIATMSLHLAWAVDNFVFKAKPELKIRIRMGINSGAVVAGCVGTKMPRYCLFGDTVNTASRMESSSAPGRIQMSESTAELLKKSGKFEVVCRGELEIKGKGKMTTYWLEGKQNFDPAKLPSVFEEAQRLVEETSASGLANFTLTDN